MAAHDQVEQLMIDEDLGWIVISGPTVGSPTAASLAAQLSEARNRRVTVDLRLLVEERQSATSGG